MELTDICHMAVTVFWMAYASRSLACCKFLAYDNGSSALIIMLALTYVNREITYVQLIVQTMYRGLINTFSADYTYTSRADIYIHSFDLPKEH